MTKIVSLRYQLVILSCKGLGQAFSEADASDSAPDQRIVLVISPTKWLQCLGPV